VPAVTLGQRRAALEQQKARLADRERKLQNDLRKARTRQLIDCSAVSLPKLGSQTCRRTLFMVLC
jgi:hypothetical protein